MPQVAEDSLALPVPDRPKPQITHMSDHWAVRVKLLREPGAPSTAGAAGAASEAARRRGAR